MDVWDRLCTLLRARKVSVEDVSNKARLLSLFTTVELILIAHARELCVILQAGMELRVLFAAANGLTWYGQWDYTFGRGPFNISKKTWRNAVDSLHFVPLADVAEDFRLYTGDQVILRIIERYQVKLVALSMVS